MTVKFQHFVGGVCSYFVGIVLHGPSGAGKTALTDWLAHATRRHCKFISVPCADLVHKVTLTCNTNLFILCAVFVYVDMSYVYFG